MKYTFHPHAWKELREAGTHYDSASAEAGESFRQEISESVSRILNFSEAWTKIRGEIRRCKVNRFPYGVIYEFNGSDVFILAVMHLNRRPNYWIDRI